MSIKLQSTTFEEATAVLKRTMPKNITKPSEVKKKGFMMFVDKDMSRAACVNKYDEVYPNIYLGDQWLARSKDTLRRMGITHIVNTAQGEAYFQVDTNEPYYADLGCKFYGIRAKDVSRFKMAPYFTDAANFINYALKGQGKVYVHCFHGISRSATIVLAFLMLHQDMSLLEAIQQVRQFRPVNPNSGFMNELVVLNNIMCEPKSVMSQRKEMKTTSDECSNNDTFEVDEDIQLTDKVNGIKSS